MAQWLGQFTGRTHKTAVLDAQDLLLHAVGVLREADDAERPKKAKAVRALAKRLYSARVHLVKARIKATRRSALKRMQPIDPRELGRLEEALAALTAGGVLAILAEFGAQDALSTPE